MIWTILENGIILVIAILVVWLMARNIRWQLQSEDTERKDDGK